MRLGIHLRLLDRRTKVEIWGDGPPILLIHGGGLGSCGTVWRGVAERLAPRWRVLVPDLVGFGGSATADIGDGMPLFVDQMAALLDALCIGSATVVGHSMGCQVALALAQRLPARAGAIGFLAPGGRIAGITDYHSAGHALMQQAVADPTPERVRRVVECVNDDLDDVEQQSAERLAAARDPAHLSAQRTLDARRRTRGQAPATGSDLAGPDLASLAMPVLLGWGDAERFNPQDLGDRIAARLPPAAIYRTFRAGHNIPHDAPAAASDAIAALAERSQG